MSSAQRSGSPTLHESRRKSSVDPSGTTHTYTLAELRESRSIWCINETLVTVVLLTCWVLFGWFPFRWDCISSCQRSSVHTACVWMFYVRLHVQTQFMLIHSSMSCWKTPYWSHRMYKKDDVLFLPMSGTKGKYPGYGRYCLVLLMSCGAGVRSRCSSDRANRAMEVISCSNTFLANCEQGSAVHHDISPI